MRRSRLGTRSFEHGTRAHASGGTACRRELHRFLIHHWVAGLVYLVYYGWSVSWWAPFVIFPLGMLACIAGLALERVAGPLVLSLAGFVGWPVSAYLMFQSIPAA